CSRQKRKIGFFGRYEVLVAQADLQLQRIRDVVLRLAEHSLRRAWRAPQKHDFRDQARTETPIVSAVREYETVVRREDQNFLFVKAAGDPVEPIAFGRSERQFLREDLERCI